MSQPSFYIFGVPNGFDLLDGDLAATNYFQNYYNPSKENTKFSIHRNAGDGMITYAYLKYNLTSGKGREGSFFGMALVFTENSCCTDFLKLYRLFDTIYDKVILADGEILEPTDGSSYIQAKYKITRFNEKREYIMQKVLPNLLSNLNTFADAFIPVDDTFSSSQPDLGVRIPYDNADNKKILNTLRHYNRLSISPSWSGPEPPPEIPEEVLYRWHSEVSELSLYVNKCFQNISRVNISEVKKKVNQSSKICETFKTHTYPKDASEEVIQCYNETKEQYKTLYKSLKSLINQIEEKSIDSSSSQNTPPLPPPIPPTPWWKDPKILGLVGGGAGLVILLVLLVINNLPKDENTIDRTPFIEGKIRYYIAEGDYQTALTLAEDSLKAARYHHFQDTIADIQTLTRIDSLIQPDKRRYSDAWELSEELNDSTTQANTQQKLSSQCLPYLKELTENVKDAKSAQATKSIINNCKVYIDQTEKDKMIAKLDTIIRTAPRNSGSTSSAPSSVPQYKVILYKSNRRLDQREGTPIYVTTTQKTITCQNGDRFVYYIADQNGVAINDPNCIQAPYNLKCSTKMGHGWYGIREAGTIKVKRRNFECEITIKYKQ